MTSRMQAGSFAEELHRRAVRMRQFVISGLTQGLATPRIMGKHRQVGEQLGEIAVAVSALEAKTREFVETLRATNVIPIVGGRPRKIRKPKRG
jgi:hypothetical protein